MLKWGTLESERGWVCMSCINYLKQESRYKGRCPGRHPPIPAIPMGWRLCELLASTLRWRAKQVAAEGYVWDGVQEDGVKRVNRGFNFMTGEPPEPEYQRPPQKPKVKLEIEYRV